MKKIAKGEYDVTTSCVFNAKMFATIMSCLTKDEDGELWFDSNKYKKYERRRS